MKKTILIIGILVILAGIVTWEVQSGKFFVEKNISEETPVENNSLSMSVNFIHQTDNFYNIQVEYPQFKNVSASFNKEISDLITGEIENFKKDAKANWEARRATATPENPVPENPTTPFDFIATWTPTQINDKYISFVINIYYFVGGAHGVTEVDAFNYDIEKNKDININDFLGSSEALTALSELTAERITSQLQSGGLTIDNILKQMIQEGTQPTQENFNNFNFNSNSLIIYFQQYQVAPGYIGPVTITLYKTDLDANSITSNYLK